MASPDVHNAHWVDKQARPVFAGEVDAYVTKPRLLDLFCGAGGAAMGYHRAGFDVVGVDIAPQPNYPFEFIQADALEWLDAMLPHSRALDETDAIHASPPCQAHSSIAKQQRTRRPGAYEHPDLVEDTRRLLRATGLPYVIENVLSAPLENAVMLCGSSFGLDVRRHRLFESNVPILSLPCAHHWQTPRFRSLDTRRSGLASVVGVHGHLNYSSERALREAAMNIDWMTPEELAQAIPPAMTEHIGSFLLAEVRRRSLERAA
jgi:DNA (cytosine-5)-methyltransferase 1